MNRRQIFTTLNYIHSFDFVSLTIPWLILLMSFLQGCANFKHVPVTWSNWTSTFPSWTAIDAIQPCSFGNLNAIRLFMATSTSFSLSFTHICIYIYMYVYIYIVAVKLYFDFFELHLFCEIGLTKTVHIVFVFSLFELIWMNCGVPQIPGSLQGFVLFVVFFNQSEMQRRTHSFTDDSFQPQRKPDFKIYSWNLSRERQMELEHVFFQVLQHCNCMKVETWNDQLDCLIQLHDSVTKLGDMPRFHTDR